MNQEDKNWVKSLPLLLTAAFLLIGAAWAFYKGKDGTGSIAAFSAGLVLLGAWLTTAIIDWHRGKRGSSDDYTY